MIALLLVAGCATEAASPEMAGPHQPPGAPGVTLTVNAGPSLDALRRAAALQATSPDRASPSLAIPPGLSATDAAPIPDAPGAPARLALDEVLKQFDGPLPGTENLPKSELPSEDSRRQALRLYASARSRLFRGDSGGAIVDLESATRLDPMSSAPWRELGEAQLQQGKRTSAMQSFQQAVRRGCREARILWLLGRDSLRAGRPKNAAEFLAAARDTADEDGDPALPNVVNTELADALRQLGYLRASVQAMADGLLLPDQFGATRMRVEVGELLRRRGDLYRDLGDALCRLGDYPAALEAYSQSQQLPTLDPTSIIPRQIYAYMKLGRPAQAALVLVEQINGAGGRADERVLALIPYVASSPTVAKDLAGAIGELAAILRQGVSPTVADRLVRAQAAAARPPEARALLRRHIMSSPPFASGTTPALTQFLSTFERNDTEGRVRELVALIADSPLHAPLCAAALLNSPADLDRALSLLPADGGSDAQTLFRAYLLALTGIQTQAADLVTNRKWTERFASAGAFAETTLNAQIGRWDLARAAYNRPALKALSPGLTRLRSRSALNLQQPREALDSLSPLVDPASGADRGRMDDLIEAGRLSAVLDDAKGAEGYFKRAADADPFDERSYDGLLVLYGPGGSLTDGSKLGDTARLLRDSCPSSRSLRLNAADEMAQRQIDTQAEQMLIDLVEEDLSDSDAGTMLVSVWDQRAQSAKTPAAREVEKPRLARAEAWLRARIAERPEQPWLWSGLARILVAQGRAEEAVSMLGDRLKARPIAALAQSREAILRDPLNRAQEADRLALERLGPTPRSLEASVELADLYVRLNRSADAATALREAIPQGISLSDSQTSRLVLLLLRVSQGTTGVAADANGAGALFDVVAERTIRLPPQLHETRLAILTSRPEPDDKAIRAALDLAVRQHPALAGNFYSRVAAAFAQSNDRLRQARAIPYLRLAVQKSAAPGVPVMTELARLTVVVGSVEDLRLLVEQFDDPERIGEVLRELIPGADLKLPSEPSRARAEFAYTLGNALSAQDRREMANEAYRLTIGLDPGHAWAKNNLGYDIVESNGDMAEAARLLEEAYAGLPNESSVIDSLAWLRYKQGVFADETGPEGKVVREGAITLLERAAATEKGSNNATIFDHLGDSLWAGGKPDEAGKAWARASAIAQDELAQIRKDPRSPRAVEEAAAKSLRAILAKQKSLADGQEPAIAPRIGGR